MAHLVTSLKLRTDFQSDLKIFNKDILRFLTSKAKSYELEAVQTIKAIKIGFIVREIPINCIPRVYWFLIFKF